MHAHLASSPGLPYFFVCNVEKQPGDEAMHTLGTTQSFPIERRYMCIVSTVVLHVCNKGRRRVSYSLTVGGMAKDHELILYCNTSVKSN